MIRFVLLLAVTVTCALGGCPAGWREFKGYCYSFNREPLPWASAYAFCNSIGARLAEIDGAERDQWLIAQLDQLNFSQTFVGLTRRIRLVEWLWEPSLRNTAKYSNWNPGEPNNYGLNEECLEIKFSARKGWNDIYCGESRPYICEKRLNIYSVDLR
uniref:C-type lectin domain-containing protein n=1 Tax=Arion vulgaris TaxID=1028688 RepID=A0A0B7B8E9_9EUPU